MIAMDALPPPDFGILWDVLDVLDELGWTPEVYP